MSAVPRPHPHSRLRKRPEGGFALLLTVTLLAFLVLILVALASLTRVETQVAGNAQQLAQARQNALMALNIALGEVQRSTGPDRRVTAPANLSNAAAASPRWVGVYGNTAAADYSQIPSAITPAAPQLVQWLVSGNEAVSILADETGTITSPLATFPVSPSDAVAVNGGGSFEQATATSELTIGGKVARLLVGPKSADPLNAATDYVAAPLVEIKAPADTVPGVDAPETVVGGYAWWVGDESTKAKINLRDSYLSQSETADQTSFQRYGFITAQRSAVELMDYDAANTLAGTYSGTDPDNVKLVSPKQLPFVAADVAGQAKLAAATKSRFHDLTARGQGVLADAYAGGLKKDLSADIADTTASASGNRPGDATPIFPREKSTDRVPTWGLLRSFPRTIASSGSVTPTPPALDSNRDYLSAGVSPVINFAALGLDFYLDEVGDIQVAMFPVVILWNPYAATLPVTDYEVGFHVATIDPSSDDHSRYFIETRPTNSGGYTTVATLDLRAGALLSGSAGGGSPGFIRFALRGEEMAPGEAQFYVLGAPGVYSAGSSTMRRYSPGVNGITNYVSWTQLGMGITPAVFENGEMRVRTVNPSGRHALNVVLAKPGRLANWDGTNIGTEWYQAVLDNNLQVRGASGTWTTPFPQAGFATMPTASVGASTTMYASTVMEGRGGFNSQAWAIGALGIGRYRWLITGNPRALVVRNTTVENFSRRGNVLFGSLGLFTKTGGGNGRDPLFPYIGRTRGYNTMIGGSQEGGADRAVLFDVLGAPDRLLSLGQFQHAPMGIYGFYSTYPFANAWADVRIPRAQHFLTDRFSPNFGTTSDSTLYDLSWHLNRALWDRYFVSGIPTSWTAADVAAVRVPPNARMNYYRRNGSAPNVDDLRYAAGSEAYDKAAANLLVDGAFNVNSTSEQAWRAVLASTLGIPDNPEYADPGDSVSTIAPVPRFSGNQSQPGRTATMSLDRGIYLGNRGLQLPSSNAALAPPPVQELVNELARAIVAEVKARGPFLSVADFVNRRLVPENDPKAAAGIRGALQAAIDSMGTTEASTASVNTRAWTDSGAALWAGLQPRPEWSAEHFLGAPIASSTSQNATRFVGAPKFLTQADLLSLLGPALTVRGDTFVIRTYGETRNAVTGAVEGRAWCEAHVQRLPDFVDDSMPAETDLRTAPASPAKTTNQTLGRRYEIVSLRWLSPSDI